jgi:hypothetical protein
LPELFAESFFCNVIDVSFRNCVGHAVVYCSGGGGLNFVARCSHAGRELGRVKMKKQF